MDSNGSSQPRFPSLPIVTRDPVPAPPSSPRSQREKYGLAFYLGILGLVVLASLLSWFGYRAWEMRDVWRAVYVLNDPSADEADRINAAHRLVHDPRVEQAQLWSLCLDRRLPEPARLILAEGITVEFVANDLDGYTLAVCKSPDWPIWLRLALTRPLAQATTLRYPVSREQLGELRRMDDPILSLWALYAQAVQNQPDPSIRAEIEKAAASEADHRELAEHFLKAIDSDEQARLQALEWATEWNHRHHPETRRLLDGWELRDGVYVKSPTN